MHMFRAGIFRGRVSRFRFCLFMLCCSCARSALYIASRRDAPSVPDPLTHMGHGGPEGDTSYVERAPPALAAASL